MADQRSGVCLCIIFNHPFVANIPVLRAIYGKRFAAIRFLVPFERSDEPDILTVYRGSFAHCAYAAEHGDALDTLGCAHYVFIHDDVLLSPWLNQDNIVDFLGLRDDGDGYIGVIHGMPQDVSRWGFQIGSLWRLKHMRNYLSGTGVENLATALRYLPDPEEAARRAAACKIPATTTFSLEPGGFDPEQHAAFRYFDASLPDDAAFVAKLAELLFGSAAPARQAIPYPIACSGPNTDFYVVPGKYLAVFIHYAAVLATAGLFVEMAAPTALMLACDRVRTAGMNGVHHDWRQHFVSPQDALAELLHDRTIATVHPVKLSQLRKRDGFIAGCDIESPEASALLQHAFEPLVMAEFPDFDAACYLAMNADLVLANAEPHQHFYRHGQFENRRWKADA